MARFLLAAVVAAVFFPSDAVRAVPAPTSFFPGGAQRGTSVDVAATGNFPHWPPVVWTSDPNVVVTPTDEKAKFRIEVAGDARPGKVWIRLADQEGAAPPRSWMVGHIAEVVEEENNDTVARAQAIDLAAANLQTIVVNGRLQDSGDADVYRISVAEGQSLVADFDALEELATPLDGVLQILRPEGFVAAHNDDQQKMDPRIALEVPDSGDWKVRVFGFPQVPTDRVQLAGQEDFVYRLTLSTGPYVIGALPLSARAGEINRWQVFGANLSDELTQLELTPASVGERVRLNDGRFARSVVAPCVDFPQVLEAEPNTPDEPLDVPIPVMITGRLDAAKDRDAFRVSVKTDEQLVVNIESRRLGYPLDPVLKLIDGEGKQVARADDQGAELDAALTHKVASDGSLVLVVADLYDAGGPEFFYRMSIKRGQPECRLTTPLHAVQVKQGATVDVEVAVERKFGYSESIEVVAEGLPEGVTAEAVTSTAGDDSAAKVAVQIRAAADAGITGRAIRLIGRSDSEATMPVRFAIPGHFQQLADIWLTVLPAE